MATKKKPPRATKVIGASLDESDQERLKAYIARERERGIKMKPGQALGALMRRGLDVVEQEAQA